VLLGKKKMPWVVGQLVRTHTKDIGADAIPAITGNKRNLFMSLGTLLGNQCDLTTIQ